MIEKWDKLVKQADEIIRQEEERKRNVLVELSPKAAEILNSIADTGLIIHKGITGNFFLGQLKEGADLPEVIDSEYVINAEETVQLEPADD